MERFFVVTVSAVIIAAVCLTACSGRTEKTDTYDFQAMLRPVPESARLVDPGYFVWCGTMVKDDTGKYHIYYSRWERELGFNAWVTDSEVAHAVSDSPLGPWEFSDLALPPRGAEYWDGMCTHNPTVYRFENKYYLYYMGNRGDGRNLPGLNWTHRNNQRIGVAVSDSPYGPWTRFDEPVLDVSSDPEAADALMTSNPAVTQCGKDGFLMVYKAVGKHQPLPFGGPVVHLSARSSSPTGPFVKDNRTIFKADGASFPAEDPFLWYQDGKYFVIIKDQNGYFIPQKGRTLVLFQSEDGENWSLAPQPVVSDCTVHWASGEVQHVEYLERPQLFFEDGRPAVLLAAVGIKGDDGSITESYNIQIPLAK